MEESARAVSAVSAMPVCGYLHADGDSFELCGDVLDTLLEQVDLALDEVRDAARSPALRPC
jgi:hypothetical protein